MRTVLTIAGSDPIAGAGIQADLKTFAALGVFGVSAVTAITSQNTASFAGSFQLPASVLRSQLDAITADVSLAAVKTGMFGNEEAVAAAADVLSSLTAPLVVDPVMLASAPPAQATGTLLTTQAVSILKGRLLPGATVLTPNIPEAEALTGRTIDSLDAVADAARHLADLGAAAVVVKGGHLAGAAAIDTLLYRGEIIHLDAPRSPYGDVRGTGCTFASAIAARLACGDDVPAAVASAKRYVTGAIEHSIAIGRGARVLNHFWELSL